MIVFCITSENYMKYTYNFLQTLNEHITPLVEKVHCLGINLTDETIKKIKNTMTNVKTNVQNLQIDFDSLGCDLPSYAACARAFYLPELLEKYKKDVMYIDADVHVLSRVDNIYCTIKGSDWGVATRYPALHPDTNEQLVGIIPLDILNRIDEVHLNAGIIYVKYSNRNIEYAKIYKKMVEDNGITWLSDQNTLRKFLTIYKKEIVIGGMPDSACSKTGNVLRHYRGPSKESKYPEYREILARGQKIQT